MKKLFLFLVIGIFFLLNSSSVFAGIGNHLGCDPDKDVCDNDSAGNMYSCQPSYYKTGPDKGKPVINHNTNKQEYSCEEDTIGTVFGKIPVPGALGGLIANNPTGAGAISQFLSNFIALLFSVAAIVLVFMLVWAGFEWLTSGGEKEKVAAAQKRILNAIIGIILLAVAFAIIAVLGKFTGFTFFQGQGIRITRDDTGRIIKAVCPGGYPVLYFPKDPDAECRKK